MTKCLVVLLVLGGCTIEESVGSDGPFGGRTEVALIPVSSPSKDVDILFVLDDSPNGGIELQTSLQRAFPSFLEGLSLPAGLPNLHIGVVSTDLGTRGADDEAAGPSIGAGPGSCASNGKDGALHTVDTLVTGAFISDRDTGDGSREANYTGTLGDAFTAISSLGDDGCSFGQTLGGAKRALEAKPMNAGVLRADALLGGIFFPKKTTARSPHRTSFGAPTDALRPNATVFGAPGPGSPVQQPGEKTKLHN